MKYVRYIRYAVPALLILYVVWQALLYTSAYIASSSLSERTPAIGVLLPAGRVEQGMSGVALMYEPVYLDVALPPRASAVTLELTTTVSSQPLRLGVRQGPGWDYVFPEVQVSEQGYQRTYRLRVGSWQYVEPTYALRFLVSVSGLVPGSIVFTGARVTVEREPFSFGWLVSRIQNLL
jgi:hypothetical protein